MDIACLQWMSHYITAVHTKGDRNFKCNQVTLYPDSQTYFLFQAGINVTDFYLNPIEDILVIESSQ